MKSWLPVIVVWFLSLFISTVVVTFFACKEFNKRKRRWKSRWKNIRNPFPVWILLLLLLVAFMTGVTWSFVESSNGQNEAGSHWKAWLFVGLCTGSFAMVCALIVIRWNKSLELAVRKRSSNPEFTHESSNSTVENTVQRFLSYPSRGPRSGNDELVSNSSYGAMDLGPKDDILVLRNLANADEDYCINLSNSSATVLRKQHLTPNVVVVHETSSPKPVLVLTLQDGFTSDFQC